MHTEITPLIPSFHAVAVNATEMLAAQLQIRTYLEGKLAELALELKEIDDALEVATMSGWKTTSLSSRSKRLRDQILYHQKLAAAIQAGYTIVPNMPMDVFAIRVSEGDKPRAKINTSSVRQWAINGVRDDRERVLPEGIGHYASPKQLFEVTEEHIPGVEGGPASKIQYHANPTSYDQIEFPMAAAHPVVMSATQEAMARRLFDRIGIVPQQVRQGDPIILGQICYRPNSTSQKFASFLIAWHLDVRTL